MLDAGLLDFGPVQNNVSFNAEAGVTRGLHAEPWDKFISVANGSVFGAWVDLRKGPSFGKTFSIEINPGVAVFVPLGVANGFQTLEDNVVYTYLVNAHWSPDAKYTFVNLFDPALNIDWPISKDETVISDKDASHPMLADVTPIEV
jgi:dTDP-4-dehydrorhamnose 3,5-epimerase